MMTLNFLRQYPTTDVGIGLWDVAFNTYRKRVWDTLEKLNLALEGLF